MVFLTGLLIAVLSFYYPYANNIIMAIVDYVGGTVVDGMITMAFSDVIEVKTEKYSVRADDGEGRQPSDYYNFEKHFILSKLSGDNDIYYEGYWPFKDYDFMYYTGLWGYSDYPGLSSYVTLDEWLKLLEG